MKTNTSKKGIFEVQNLIHMRMFLCLLISLSSIVSQAQSQEKEIQQVMVDVVYLASDFLQGRETGTKGEQMAADYIAHRYAQLDMKMINEEDKYFQPFPFKQMRNPHDNHTHPPKIGKGKNVIGYMDNGADKTIIIGAHYDHLGMGKFGSLHAGEPAIHNGADDNASGIAAMLLMADWIKAKELKESNFLFIAFSGEEMGLFGSKYYADHPSIDLSKVSAMINMDMVGRLNEEKVIAINGVGTSPGFKDMIANNKTAGITAATTDSGIGPSDHTSFYLKDVPVLHFFTGQHMDYHKPGDDSHLVNYTGIHEVSSYIYTLIDQINGQDQLAFTKTKDAQEQKASAFKVTLGVMPDYVYTGKGMRIDSVIDGRVADKGGLKNGDIVIKLGDIEVTDIYKYMEGLGKYEKGEKANVTVLRKGKKVMKEVTF